MLDILWIYLDKLKYKDFLASIKELKNKTIIFTPNPEIILKAAEDKEFKELLSKANYLIPDWIWIYIAYQIISLKEKIKKQKYISPIFSTFIFILLPYFVFNIIFRKKYLYKKYWDKICWSDLTRDLLDFANNKKIKITIIDLYNPTDIKKVESQKIFSDKLKEIYQNLDFDYFICDENKKNKIVEDIKKSDSKILFSTLGMKRQEKSVVEIMEKCESIKIWMWIWSSFDYIIWFQKRAPKIWRNIWLEWLYRLVTWPQKSSRLKRLWNAIFVFIYKVVTN